MHKAENKVRPFVIFSLARCGSNCLADIINSHVSRCCLYEPFNPSCYSAAYHTIAAQKGVPAAFAAMGTHTSGFCHVWNAQGWPFPSNGFKHNADILQSGRLVIFLHRRNVRQRIVSEQIARQTNVWRMDSSSAVSVRNSKAFKEINPAGLDELAGLEIRAKDRFRELLIKNGAEWIDVAYEDAFSEDAPLEVRIERTHDVVGKIIGEKNVNDAMIGSKFTTFPKEYRSQSLYTKISNWDDLKSGISEYVECFE